MSRPPELLAPIYDPHAVRAYWSVRRHAIAAIWFTALSFSAVAGLLAARMFGLL